MCTLNKQILSYRSLKRYRPDTKKRGIHGNGEGNYLCNDVNRYLKKKSINKLFDLAGNILTNLLTNFGTISCNRTPHSMDFHKVLR